MYGERMWRIIWSDKSSETSVGLFEETAKCICYLTLYPFIKALSSHHHLLFTFLHIHKTSLHLSTHPYNIFTLFGFQTHTCVCGVKLDQLSGWLLLIFFLCFSFFSLFPLLRLCWLLCCRWGRGWVRGGEGGFWSLQADLLLLWFSLIY